MAIREQQLRKYLSQLGINHSRRATTKQLHQILDRLCYAYGLIEPRQIAGGKNYLSACEGCQEYVRRSQSLRPFKLEDLELLKLYAEACNQCSIDCMEDLELAKRSATLTGNSKIKNEIKTKCIESTKAAILAKKEQDRLESKALDKLAKIKAFQTQHQINTGNTSIFPPIPLQTPQTSQDQSYLY